jgi:hypothetical protein
MIKMRMPASRETIGWRCAMPRVMLRALLKHDLRKDADFANHIIRRNKPIERNSDSKSNDFAPDVGADGAKNAVHTRLVTRNHDRHSQKLYGPGSRLSPGAGGGAVLICVGIAFQQSLAG